MKGVGCRVEGQGFGPRPTASHPRTTPSLLTRHLVETSGFRFSNEKQFRGGLVFKVLRLVVSLNSRPRVIKKKKKV